MSSRAALLDALLSDGMGKMQKLNNYNNNCSNNGADFDAINSMLLERNILAAPLPLGML